MPYPQSLSASTSACSGGRLFLVGALQTSAAITSETRLSHRHANATLPGLEESITANVLLNEYSGERSILTLTSGDAQLQAVTTSSDDVGRGEEVELYYDPDNVLVFDAETEELLV